MVAVLRVEFGGLQIVGSTSEAVADGQGTGLGGPLSSSPPVGSWHPSSVLSIHPEFP